MSSLFDAVSSAAWLVYLLTFIFVFLEAAGLPLPALTFALLAASLAGSGQLSFAAVFLATVLGGTLGGPVGHVLGQRGGRPLLDRLAARVRLSPERITAAEEQFVKRGKALLMGRYFIPILPWAAGLLAGIVRMPRRTLVIYNAIGITLWALIQLTIVAYFSSVLVDLVSRFSIEGLFWVATGVVGLIVLIIIFRQRRAARRASVTAEVLAEGGLPPEANPGQPPASPTPVASLAPVTSTASEEVPSSGPPQEAGAEMVPPLSTEETEAPGETAEPKEQVPRT
jgi:membrane protein DedA with SNARE-associated domain